MNVKHILIWIGRIVLLLLLFYVIFISGTIPVSGMLPKIKSEPGLLPDKIGFLIFGITNMLLIMGMILNLRWSGWKLSLYLAFAYYGAVTFLTQIETWYFMSNITVDNHILPLLFIMGLPIAFIYIPIAVLILGKGRATNVVEPALALRISTRQLIWKLFTILIAYIVLYWCAG